LVSDVSKRKFEVRQEITSMEIEVRRLKEQIATKRLENTNMEYLIKREQEL
jgi:hypothetical protein